MSDRDRKRAQDLKRLKGYSRVGLSAVLQSALESVRNTEGRTYALDALCELEWRVVMLEEQIKELTSVSS